MILNMPFLFFGFITSKETLTKKIVIVFIILVGIKIGVISLIGKVTLTDLITYLLYCSGFMLFEIASTFNRLDSIKILNTVRKSIYLIGFIYVMQYFFYTTLPVAFTDLPNLFVEIGVEKYTREVLDVVIYRPNGLIGNPISLGFFLNIILLIELYIYNVRPLKFQLVLILIIAVMIILLFSRANVMLMTCILISNFLFYPKSSSKRLTNILIGTLVSGLLIISLGSNFDFLVSRIMGDDTYALASNAEHLKDYELAIEYILNNPFIGITPQESLDYQIITDGAIFAIILNIGLFIFVNVLFLCQYVIKAIYYQFRKDKSFTPIFVFMILLIPYSFINSALLNRGLFLLLNIVIGIFYNLTIKEKKND